MKREELRQILGDDVESETINQLLDAFHAETDAKVTEVQDAGDRPGERSDRLKDSQRYNPKAPERKS